MSLGAVIAALMLVPVARGLTQSAPPVERWALVGGTVIPATGEAPIADGVVLLRGSRITAVGADFLKVAVSAHGIGPVEPLMFSTPALGAMRAAAQRSETHFQTHTFTLESLREAVAVRPQLLLHPNVMSDPYLGAVIQSRQPGATAEAFAARRTMVQRWLRARVKVVIGTDQGPEASELGPVVWGRMGRRHFEVMEGLQEAGASPMDLLVAATRHGAEAYGLADSLGTVQAGKVADLLVVDADPLVEIRHLRQIRYVVKGGRMVDRAALPTLRVLQFDPEASWPH